MFCNGRYRMEVHGPPSEFDRDAALEQAMVLFWERGSEETSIGDLTRAMGIGAPSLYAAFGDKRSLFEEAASATRADPAPPSRPRAGAVEQMLERGAVASTRRRTSPRAASSSPSRCSTRAARRRGTSDPRAPRRGRTGELPRPTRCPRRLRERRDRGHVRARPRRRASEDLAAIAALAMRAWPNPQRLTSSARPGSVTGSGGACVVARSGLPSAATTTRTRRASPRRRP